VSLSQDSINKLQMLREAILASPKFYKQDRWVASISTCGTTCCLAGWADFLVNGERVHAERAKRLKGSWLAEREWIEVTATALGITQEQADRLTDSSTYWPEPFCNQYDDGDPPKKRAAIAAARIDHFIKTGGDE